MAFSVGNTLSEGWQLLKGGKWPIWRGLIVGYLIMFAITVPIALMTGSDLSSNTTARASPEESLISILTQILIGPIVAGTFALGIVRARGQTPRISILTDNYTSRLIAVPVFYVLSSIAIVLGFILLILPGIYLMLCYTYGLGAIADRNTSAWETLGYCRKGITKAWFAVSGLNIILMLINFLAIIPLGIGLIWSVPYMAICNGIVYRDLIEPLILADRDAKASSIAISPN